MTRTATARLDSRRQISIVDYRIERFSAPVVEETHVMRFFFPRETELLLECAGFELLSLTPAGSLDREPDTATWTAQAVARVV